MADQEKLPVTVCTQDDIYSVLIITYEPSLIPRPYEAWERGYTRVYEPSAAHVLLLTKVAAALFQDLYYIGLLSVQLQQKL